MSIIKLRYLTLIIFLFVNSYSYSQVYVFIVCGNRGENRVKTDGEWKLLKTQSTITDFDEIKTSGEDCYLGLLHSSGRSIVIRKPGIYNAEDLLKKVNTGNTAVASKYADFVYSKMITVADVPVSGKRGAGDEAIKVFLPKSGQVFGTEQIIMWSAVQGSDLFKVRINNIFDESIKEYQIKNNLLKLDLTDPDLMDQNALFITVESESNPSLKSEVYGITRLVDAKHDSISQNYNKLKSELLVESPINNLIIASYFEDHNLLIDAVTYYEKFLESSPGLSDFETMYEEFLTRNGMN